MTLSLWEFACEATTVKQAFRSSTPIDKEEKDTWYILSIRLFISTRLLHAHGVMAHNPWWLSQWKLLHDPVCTNTKVLVEVFLCSRKNTGIWLAPPLAFYFVIDDEWPGNVQL